MTIKQAQVSPAVDSETLRISVDRLLASIGDRAHDIGERRLTLHWPLVGSRFDAGVLVIGQAVYGWFGDWTAGAARDPERRAQVIDDAANLFSDRPDRMDWVQGHRVWNSPFWRVACEVTDTVAPGEGEFFSRLAWANLYPVAPNDIKSNPGGALLEAQTNASPTVLDAVIDVLQPRVVLVAGGPYVWAFDTPLGLGVLESRARPIYRAGWRNGRIWILGMHPGGASRRGFGPTRYASRISAEIASLAGERGA